MPSFQGKWPMIRKAGESVQLETDRVVYAMGSRANRSCIELESSGRPVSTVRDALETTDIAAAVHEGFRATMEI